MYELNAEFFTMLETQVFFTILFVYGECQDILQSKGWFPLAVFSVMVM